ncbi:MAG: FAD:protein FMN transferase [Geobacteraceae bacterium]|nr:FAD:protein FMN transferase [Geobacteraceae bacterium]
MDTFVTVKVYGSDRGHLQQSVNEAFGEMRRIAELADHFPQAGTAAYRASDVCAINEKAGIRPVRVHSDTITMLTLARQYAELSHGAFDPAIGAVTDLWNFSGDNPVIPVSESIRQRLKLSGFRYLTVNRDNSTVYVRKKGVKLDLGASAKGYATEKAYQILKRSGIDKALIDAGGNIRTIGTNREGKPWKIGIKDPRREGGLIGTVSVENGSAVTSGDYYRFFERDGSRYHHILDPRTGYPGNHTMSATVVTQDSALADILSTACFVLPPSEALALATGLKEVDLLLITSDKKIIHTPTLTGRIEINPNSGYRYDQGR